MPNAEEVAKRPKRRSERFADSHSGPSSKKRKVEALPDPEFAREKAALALTEEFVLQHLSLRQAAEIVIKELVSVFFFFQRFF